jgi:hypothetical protein
MSDLRQPEVRDNSKIPVESVVFPTVIENRFATRSHPEAVPEVLELQNRLKIRSDICRFLIKTLRFSTISCFALIVLQGFHPWGFQMDAALLKWLCAVTIAKSGVLLAVFTNAVWQRTYKIPNRTSPKDFSGHLEAEER